MSPDPKAYLHQALSIMEANSLARGSVDWGIVRREAERMAAGAAVTSDVYPAIRQVLALLGDGHSFFKEPDEVAHWRRAEHNQGPSSELRAELLFGSIGYVLVPPLLTGKRQAHTVYANSLCSAIGSLDGRHLIGWIVDLRQNSGGNMWPMLAGLGSLLGEGRLGSFVYPDGTHGYWWHRRGQAGLGEQILASVAWKDDRLRGSDLPVVVLTGRSTASSGEAVAVAFRGRAATRSLGLPTAGKSTANSLFQLSDGAMLILAVAAMADRTGRVHGTTIHPDSLIPDEPMSKPLEKDPVVVEAVKWIQTEAP